ncbi:hypothetical protein EVAR_43696_1 [Eumeta japonica]|uniref:Uncharacterized protein n=1 Tax=Eumeta variegata TaxID=151549 RepID=A0A4C1X0M2_EUMVA|nr:hypothetical protein EVAR_43696_1 [Eumeta japonica]
MHLRRWNVKCVYSCVGGARVRSISQVWGAATARPIAYELTERANGCVVVFMKCSPRIHTLGTLSVDGTERGGGQKAFSPAWAINKLEV